LALRYGVSGHKQADQYLRAARIVPRELFELNAPMAISMMVDRGLGVSLVPDIVIADDFGTFRRPAHAAGSDGTAPLRRDMALGIAASAGKGIRSGAV